MAPDRRHRVGPLRGQHRRPRRRSLPVVVVVVLVMASAVGVAAYARGDGSASPCKEPRELEVVAAVELVPAVKTAVSFLPCVRADVRAGDASAVARQVARGSTPPEVWIPDSSRWVTGAGAPSVAWSPVVLSISADTLRRWRVPATLDGLARAAAADRPISLTTDGPGQSAAAQAAVGSLVDALSATPTSRGHLAALLRGMGHSSAPRTAEKAGSVRPSTEQAVWASNKASGADELRSIYLSRPGRKLDYPFVVSAETDPAVRQDANALLSVLTNPAGTAVIEGLGFRSPTGQVNSQLTRSHGVAGAGQADASPLTRPEAEETLRLIAALSRPSRVLALVDVSGSMAQLVPDTPQITRIELARAAIGSALRLFPRGTVAGVWRFSSDLTPSTNYEQVMPLTRLTHRTRRQLAALIERLDAVPYGGTGLYDSVLAAVRHVRTGYDPARVNSVVVLTDGRNEDASAHGITKEELLTALQAEADGARPVQVIAVGYGPDSDVAALRAISDATGGRVYMARNPRDLPVIFRDAIGDRLCGEGC